MLSTSEWLTEVQQAFGDYSSLFFTWFGYYDMKMKTYAKGWSSPCGASKL